jgi:excinuclease ABC subunit B
MERAIFETDRRREKQIAHNLAEGITPQALVKDVQDILEGAVAPGRKGKIARNRKKVERIDAEARDYATMSATELSKVIVRLEDDMHRAAKDMAFEKAAALRDDMMEAREFLRSV